ncbi:MAG: IS4 family transposase [Ktedonobacteraceae bacterium]
MHQGMMKTSGRERAPLMNASTLLSALQWAEDTFGTVRLGDQRRTVRAVEIASAIAHNPAASLPAQMQDDAATEAAYRFLQMPDVSYEKLIGPHVAQTRAQASKPPQVLLIQETTEVDYHQHPTTTGLGPIGNGSHHGYLVQSVLAVVPQSREVLGLMHQEPFLRQPAPKGETRREREQRQRESQVWERSVEAIGAPPAGVQWIHVGDRYSDIFTLLSLIRQQQCDFVVRAAQDRCVDLLVEQADAPVPARSHHPPRAGQAAEAKAQHLFAVVEGWQAQGQQELHLEASKQSKARVAHVVISFGSLRLLPPQKQPAGEWRPLVVWVVRVWEPEPPQGVEGLEWVRLPSVPTATVEQAWQRVDWYRARWIVEDYHQGLKTGCSIELRQLQSYEALRRLLGLLAPTAVRLLQLRATARDAPERRASEVLPTDLVQVVALLAKVPAASLTAQQCWYTIARYGGYLRRRSGGPPGWKTLWKGWFYIQTLLEGVHLAPRLSLE